MRIKIEPPDLDGFDEFSTSAGHKELAQNLTRLLTNLEHGSVAIFDGRWGIGKTTFVRRWLAHLSNEKIPAIYLDAFAVDYLESPFVALAGAFAAAAIDASAQSKSAYKEFVSAASKVGKAVGGTAAKIGVKALTLGVIGSSEIKQFEEMKDVIADALSEQAEASIKDLIEEHSRKDRELAALKSKLSEFPAMLSEDGAPPRPLIVVIDELDRCRPDFALGMLESVKHFFGAPNIHFILVTNREHLLLSVAHKYGAFPTADEYLRKFYDFQIQFEQDYGQQGSFQIRKRIETLASALLGQISERQQIEEFVQAAAIAHRLTLRDLEGVFLNLALAYAAVRSNQFRPAVLVTFLALLKTIDPASYAKAKAGTLTPEELNERLFSVGDWGQTNIDRIRLIFEFYLRPDIDEDDPRFRGFGQETWNFNLARTRVIIYLCNAVIDRFAPAESDQQAPAA
jgi:hypothetical protein